MPHPAEMTWGVRSDLAYDIKHRSHARQLTNEQSGNQEDEPSILKSAGTSGQPGPSGLLFQLTLNNGVVLRKSGVATKPKSKKAKTAVPQPVLPPPIPREVKERATRKIAPEKQRKQTGRRFENSGSESEDSED